MDNMKRKIILRPHHILCIEAFQGKGYSEGFVCNMRKIILSLEENPQQYIEIRSTTDSLCEVCPNKLGENHCESNENVIKLDKNSLNYLDLEDGVYKYKELKERFISNINGTILHKICSNCGWYNITKCKEFILNKYHK